MLRAHFGLLLSLAAERRLEQIGRTLHIVDPGPVAHTVSWSSSRIPRILHNPVARPLVPAGERAHEADFRSGTEGPPPK